MLARSTDGTPARWLLDRISSRSRIGLGEAMRLRDLGLSPFDGATVFVLDDDDAVESVGCTHITQPVSVEEVLAALRQRLGP